MDSIYDYIFVTNVVPRQTCREIVNDIQHKDWKPHNWYSYSTDHFKSEPEKELDTLNTTQALQEKLAPYICQSVEEYMIKFVKQEEGRIKSFIQTFTPIRFNRYRTGTMMRQHYDHIHSIFDGKYKGIPILSIVGILNEEYEGGEFLFSSKHEVQLKAGDILLFPSNFMYPHEVKELTKGERYSFVAWAF